MTRVYLDNAATTPIDPEVFKAMVPYMREFYGNPSAIHSFGREARAGLERARRQVAKLLNCTPGEIIFTSGGTEADNMVLHCAVRDLGVKHIITSKIEHHAVELTAEALCHDGSPVKAHWVKLQEDGKPDMAHFEQLLKATKGEGVLVSIMHANNEIGTRIDLNEVGNLCRSYGALFHSDTVQTMCHYAFDLSKLPVDFITCASHKFHGPKGVGFLFMRNSAILKPLILGGGQERNMRAGTENLHGIIGLAKAMEIAYSDLEEHHSYIQGLKDYMKRELAANFPDVTFNGDTTSNGLYTVLSVCFPEDGRSAMLLYNLDIEGVACSGGSACSSGSNAGSHVLRALYPERPGANIRFSFSRFTTKADIDHTLEVLKKILLGVSVKV